MDANYWIYWFDERLPEYDSVDNAMQRAIRNGVVVSTVTLMEVAHYFRMIQPEILSEKMMMTTDLSTLSLIDFTSPIMQSSISLLSIYGQMGLSSRNCVILATMKSAGSGILLTHDHSFKNVKDIKIIDEIGS
ncbi:MAG: PIN domain-containing protein [Candidatus Thermoplasmatota archaeon]|nr:PIN domain-containing protein [Candidatus Thermoplasmatota archaeon]